MPKFTVERPELHISYVEVVADTPEQAMQRVWDGEGHEVECVYERTLTEEDDFEFKVGAAHEIEKGTCTNHYRCPGNLEHRTQHAPKEWTDIWSCACNDKCPVCNAEIEPYKSEEN